MGGRRDVKQKLVRKDGRCEEEKNTAHEEMSGGKEELGECKMKKVVKKDNRK